MNSKPLIGLSPSYYEHREMDRSILGKTYTDIVQRAGGLPVLIPPIIEKSDLAQLIQRLDGIVLTGGYDIHPAYYGESPDPLTPNPFHARRGEHDKQIFEYIWEHKIPTLAICLGMQEVNVFLGGSLYQDIPAQFHEPLTHKTGDWFDARHEVELLEGSLINKLTGSLRIDTNSAHHQAVKQVSEKLKVVGVCSDGLIEALEPVDATIPLLAVQWHPEAETNVRAGIELFSWLISMT
ncbi:MAG: gamma-glutamyl-gamma-aminobutyrate hydrolase family protein [Candidatus Marinimicrobia bacterium]|nr:gamma-glutamyl-gamma-aminobutyrate hydrolase family protein [Candidatus Neomarinimicrobiota bacterium]